MFDFILDGSSPMVSGLPGGQFVYTALKCSVTQLNLHELMGCRSGKGRGRGRGRRSVPVGASMRGIVRIKRGSGTGLLF